MLIWADYRSALTLSSNILPVTRRRNAAQRDFHLLAALHVAKSRFKLMLPRLIMSCRYLSLLLEVFNTILDELMRKNTGKKRITNV